jgi:hypothetical protein
MKYSEIVKELEYWKSVSGEENPEVVVADSHASYKFPIKKIEPFYGDIGIIINAQ